MWRIKPQNEKEEEGEMWRIKPEDMGRAEEAKRFMVNYYRTFDTNRAGLVNLYREESVLNFDGREIKGKEAILAKLTSLPQCHHEIAEFKCMPYRTGSVLISVYGETWVGGQNVMADALTSNQTFLLMPAPEGSFCVGTQIWRPFDLNKVRTPPPASKPTPTFAFLMSTLTSPPPPPPPMSAFVLHCLCSSHRRADVRHDIASLCLGTSTAHGRLDIK
ncbi:nuclear transport factor 2B [Eucalyptus grandis]|uniref:nuclear transport factor 2B n=1 Tax=Eucalyptus grandis TaxID=71139 RepID=UPI00192EFDC6|nr:nuclear transport factor 2B [Eucalyptus grandis]